MARQTKVRQNDRLMNGCEIFDGFQLNHNSAFNKKIKTVPAIELHFFVNHWKAFLPFDAQIPSAKFVEEAFFIGGFEQAGPQALVDFYCGANDRACDLVVGHEW